MATEYRANLLQRMNQKRTLDSDADDEDVENENSLRSSQTTTPTPKLSTRSKKRRRKPRADDEISQKMMDTLQKVGDALIKETGTSQTDDRRIESLAEEVKGIKDNLNKQQDQLAQILSLLQRQRN
jgi:hypothetical protein